MVFDRRRVGTGLSRLNSKYYKRISTKKGSYRYFYSKEEYDAYINSLRKNVDNDRPSSRTTKEDLEKMKQARIANQKREAWKEVIDNSQRTKKSRAEAFREASSNRDDRPKKKVKRKRKKQYINGDVVEHGISTKPYRKYYERVKTPRGTYRYFYSKKEYDAYMKYGKKLDSVNDKINDTIKSARTQYEVNKRLKKFDKALRKQVTSSPLAALVGFDDSDARKAKNTMKRANRARRMQWDAMVRAQKSKKKKKKNKR